ncbi:uncharacterized protein LOC113676613 [Rhizophagus clarus]|uniref:Uncharacterized protein LOC113676613 n=1 Tax=Rhizophagus clarus TaxID=94130 RepID=A0A8H3LHF7_9GLOM|nr:uncharacterized protein LOC113676613 [Rhizophagus clarus]
MGKHPARLRRNNQAKVAQSKKIIMTERDCFYIINFFYWFQVKEGRVRDHDYFTGKYCGPAHRGCNLQLRIKPDEIKIPLIYHGGKHYDFHHKVRELGLVSEDKIKIIADNMENYKTIIIGQIKFIDSCQFQFPSLEKVASNLRG